MLMPIPGHDMLFRMNQPSGFWSGHRQSLLYYFLIHRLMRMRIVSRCAYVELTVYIALSFFIHGHHYLFLFFDKDGHHYHLRNSVAS
jgi:hypothetical protein